MNICDKIKNFFFPPDPTPDEELVAEIKAATAKLNELSAKADSRGIRVWLKETYRYSGTYRNLVEPDCLSFHSAEKTDIQRFK